MTIKLIELNQILIEPLLFISLPVQASDESINPKIVTAKTVKSYFEQVEGTTVDFSDQTDNPLLIIKTDDQPNVIGEAILCDEVYCKGIHFRTLLKDNDTDLSG